MTSLPQLTDTLLWSVEARDLFIDLMEQGPPEAFREAAAAGVHRESERLARKRGGDRVEGTDVGRACLGITPPVFRGNVAANLANRGYDAATLTREVEAERGQQRHKHAPTATVADRPSVTPKSS